MIEPHLTLQLHIKYTIMLAIYIKMLYLHNDVNNLYTPNVLTLYHLRVCTLDKYLNS